MLRLRIPTPADWLPTVLGDLDAFFQDHAANERKASASAMTLAVQHPERRTLVSAMVELAHEEMEHFVRLYAVLTARGQTLAPDWPDPYMSGLIREVRKGNVREFLLDRLLTFGIVEARSCERFTILAEAMPDPALRAMYADLMRCEARHHALFVRLAHDVVPAPAVAARLDELLAVEADIVATLPPRPAIH
jgi:tRNA 2-(methylsulfanyl)-N6-isopentenyladenosine37 hydroxylase